MSGPTPKKAELGPPPRWLRCPRRGQVVAGKFIPFKTPLCNLYDDQIPERYRFCVDMVFCGQKVGLWIDLTNTDRFYAKEEVEKHEVGYVKINLKGRGECPTPDQTQMFIKLCRQFFKNHANEPVAVHCTHGFNRTGFLIIAYLIEDHDWSVEAAMNEFAMKRPPGIYKQDYIDELFKRYSDPKDSPMAPALPDWCDETDPILDDDEADGSAGGSASTSSSSGNQKKGKRAEFVEGVQGVNLVEDRTQLSRLQRLCQDWCGWTRDGFPGSQPVSMDINNINFLRDSVYRVSWKADGVRYMTMINGLDEVYMFDRDNNVFHVPNVRFPHRKEPDRDIRGTLVDGELVFDEDNGRKLPRYLIYDIIRFEDQEVGRTDFNVRLLCIRKELIDPRAKAKEEGRIDPRKEPFSIRMKDFWDINTIDKVLSPAFRQSGVHEFDGLIFQPVPDPYTPGRCDRVLKWKPSELNSVDFKLKIVYEKGRDGMLPGYKGYLYVLHSKEPFGTMTKVTKELKEYDNKIIECSFDPKSGWKFMRERKDKSFPNAFKTAMGVCESIRNPVTEKYLIDFVKNCAKKPQYQKRTHPDGGSSSNGANKRIVDEQQSDGRNGDNSMMPPPPPRPP